MPTRARRARSLADVAVDDEVQVRDICFDVVRAHCSRAGIHRGDVLRCVSTTGPSVVLETSGGARVELDRFFACFVEIGPAEGSLRPSRAVGAYPVPIEPPERPSRPAPAVRGR